MNVIITRVIITFPNFFAEEKIEQKSIFIYLCYNSKHSKGSPDMSQESSPAATPTLKRQNAGKGPYLGAYAEEEEEGDDCEQDMPEDLAAFFEHHDVELEDRVKICRAYANYLVSFLPKKPKRAKKE